MINYQHILCAVDLTDENTAVFSQALDLADRYQAKLSLLHVVEYIPIDLANELVLPQQQEIEQQLVKQAEQKLQVLVNGDGQAKAEPVVEQGSIKSVVIDYAESHQVDLIVVGRHGRHGLSRLLGSVAIAILHHAPCDVLTVHIEK